MNRLFKASLLLAFSWNIFLVIGVIANQNYALTRAAGGLFDSFPVGIRIAYLINLAIVIYQLDLLFRNVSRREVIIKIFFVLSSISVLVNAISRSPQERWNAIPATLIAYAFYREMKKNKA
ncbi:MAG: hypothetical protein RLZZ87_364 [Actinomycetota bacterium]|jgi:hypothetical protein